MSDSLHKHFEVHFVRTHQGDKLFLKQLDADLHMIMQLGLNVCPWNSQASGDKVVQ